jgi:hypothetical protein
LTACIHYKKVKKGMQYNCQEQPNGTGHNLNCF